MSGSKDEVRALLNELLWLLNERMCHAGQIVLHFSDGGVFQRYEINRVKKPDSNRPLRRRSDYAPLDPD